MIVSLGEVNAMVRKAARGAGWPWGHAEELGASTRALCAADLPGVALAAALLHTPGDAHCPIRLAAQWCDTRRLPETAVDVAAPLLTLPLLAAVFCTEHQSVQATWEHTVATVDQTGHARLDTAHATAQAGTTALQLALVPAAHIGERHTHPRGIAVSAADWALLDQLALHSYVPASEQSRQGAGPAN